MGIYIGLSIFLISLMQDIFSNSINILNITVIAFSYSVVSVLNFGERNKKFVDKKNI